MIEFEGFNPVLFYEAKFHFPIAFLRNRKHVSCSVLSSYTNTSGNLGEREMLWEHEPQASVSTAFLSPPKLSRVFV